MGRTRRRRLRKKSLPKEVTSLGCETDFQDLIRWLKHNGWSRTCHLDPVNFTSTGRGLRTSRRISSGQILVKIPLKCLMTVETASNSLFNWFFRRKPMLAQQVLAAHLACEKHLGDKSFWKDYIKSLPLEIMTPVFTSCDEVDSLPEDLSVKVKCFQDNVIELYRELMSSVLSVDTCPHCGCHLSQVVTEDCFLWSWFIINSRAVYITPEQNSNHDLKLTDANSLALAPYLDIFNHSNDAKVQAFVNNSDGSYQIKTLVSYDKFSQVFIHYGDHSNTKLYLEYGFILNRNIHDTISLTFDEVFCTMKEIHSHNIIAKATYKFLKTHDLLANLYLSSEGLSWSTKSLIFVLLSSNTVDPKNIQLKVYSNTFTESEINDILMIGICLVRKKKDVLSTNLQKMIEARDFVLSKPASASFVMAIDLHKEYLNVISDCEKALITQGSAV